MSGYDLGEGFCASYHYAVELIGRRWNGAILRELLLGSTHFVQIRQGIPQLTDKMLASRLRQLEAEGLITRAVYAETPVRVEYGLTEKGRDLEKAVAALSEWADRWIVLEPMVEAEVDDPLGADPTGSSAATTDAIGAATTVTDPTGTDPTGTDGTTALVDATA